MHVSNRWSTRHVKHSRNSRRNELHNRLRSLLHSKKHLLLLPLSSILHCP